MAEIKLEAPGKLRASAENAKDYQFFIVHANAKYTKEAFEKNPNIASGNDLLFKSKVFPDKEGRAECDLGPKADEIKKKLKSEKTKVKVAVVANQKPENREPEKPHAVVKDFTLVNPLGITLKPIRPMAQAQDWVAYHTPICFLEMSVRGPIKEVEVSYGKCGNIMTMFAAWEQAQAGTHKCKKLVLGACGDPGANKGAYANPAQFYKRGWWSGVPGWDRGKVKMPVKEGINYVLGFYPRGAGSTTVTVKGTGSYASISAKATIGLAGRHPRPGD